MKRSLFQLVLLAIIMLSFSACDDNEVPTPDELEGTWEAVSFSATAVVEAAIGETPSIEEGTTHLTASNLDYQVTFDEDSYTTSGDYDITIVTEIPGMPSTEQTESHTNVEGMGTYAITNSTITVQGSLFDLQIDGIDESLVNEEQTVNFEFNDDGELVLILEENMITEDSGFTITTTISSTSVWERQ